MRRETRGTNIRKVESAEIVIKECFVIDSSTEQDRPVPCVEILANEAGYKRLSEVFAAMALQAHRKVEDNEWNHAHLELMIDQELNERLSDEIRFHLVWYDEQIREDVLSHYDVSEDTAQRAGLVERYMRLIRRCRYWLRRHQG